jgi:1-deoxy-D-xylulose-5-phosphate reductoisomerase
VAVEAFLEGRINWVGIAELLDASLQVWDHSPASTLEDVLAADERARAVTRTVLAGRSVA